MTPATRLNAQVIEPGSSASGIWPLSIGLGCVDQRRAGEARRRQHRTDIGVIQRIEHTGVLRGRNEDLVPRLDPGRDRVDVHRVPGLNGHAVPVGVEFLGDRENLLVVLVVIRIVLIRQPVDGLDARRSGVARERGRKRGLGVRGQVSRVGDLFRAAEGEDSGRRNLIPVIDKGKGPETDASERGSLPGDLDVNDIPESHGSNSDSFGEGERVHGPRELDALDDPDVV